MQLRKIIKQLLQRAGWELQRTNARARRATMPAALQWLASQRVPCATIVDVGASNGCWSATCMRSFPAANYLLFEPQPVHRAALDRFAQQHTL